MKDFLPASEASNQNKAPYGANILVVIKLHENFEYIYIFM
jgi:hypothetical protein